eukprot:1605583-Prymnesium_polylepis.1
MENVVVPPSCLGDYHRRLWVGSFWPVVVLLTFAGGFIVWDLFLLLRTGERITARLIGIGCRAGLQRFVSLMIGVTFLVTPSVSTRIFKTFRCEPIRYNDDGDGASRRYLHADLSISCDNDKYQQMRTTAFAMMACWPIGVPILYMVLLVASRNALRSGVPTPLSRAVAFMASDYDPSAFFWEPIEMCRKLTLTGESVRVLNACSLRVARHAHSPCVHALHRAHHEQPTCARLGPAHRRGIGAGPRSCGSARVHRLPHASPPHQAVGAVHGAKFESRPPVDAKATRHTPKACV